MTEHAAQTATAAAVCILLGVVVAVLYARTAEFEFVALDDYFVVVDRPELNQGVTPEGLHWAFTTILPDWQPLTALSHMLTFELAGDEPGPHHLVNAALHGLNAILLFLALLLLTGELWPSALAAALFALHPLRVESVAWVVERKDTLSGLFWMLTLLAYGWYARLPNLARYVAVLVAFACGLMSKAMLVTLPIVLLLLDLWPLARLRVPSPPSVAATVRCLGARLLEKVPLLAMSAAIAVVTFATASQAMGLKPAATFTAGWRLAMPPLAYAVYLFQSVWPVDLAVMYPHPALLGTPLASMLWPAIGAAFLLAAVTLLCLATWRSRPYLIVGWLWFLVTLLPLVGLVQVGDQWHADRFTYAPSIGLAIMLAWGLRDLVAARPRLRGAVITAAALALFALAVASRRQIGVWRDSVTLFEHAIAATTDNYIAHQTLGAVLLSQSERAAARVHLDEALRIRPEEAYAHEQLGLLYQQDGDLTQAERSFAEALRLSPATSVTSLRHLLSLQLTQGRLDDAIALLDGPVAADFTPAEWRLALGEALLQENRIDAALRQMERAVAYDPASSKAHNNLGVALARAGRYREAVAQFQEVLRLEPEHRAAAENLRYAREKLGPS